MITPAQIDLAKTPSFRLDGKRALVTGGGRGIGLAAASAVAQAIRARGDKADALPLDVTDLDTVQATIAKAEPFDVLVNNAGTNRPKMLMDVTTEDFDIIMGLNV